MPTHSPPIRAQRPFSQIVAFDWYDGPVNGLALVADCDEACGFTMLDWDERQELRAFALFRAELADYRDCVQALSAVDSPRVPLWHPNLPPDRFDFAPWLHRERERIFAVVAASRRLDEIVVYRSISPDEAVDLTEWDFDSEHPSHDWIGDLLGVAAG